MRFDFAVFAAGLFAGITAVIAVAMFIDFQWMRSAICLAEESPVVCARNWFHVLAVVAGGAAAFIVIGQIRSSERHHIQSMKLQTLETRVLFSRLLIKHIENIERRALRSLASLRNREETGDDIAPFVMLQNMPRVIGAKSAYDDIERFDDGTLLNRLDEFQVDDENAIRYMVSPNEYGDPVALDEPTQIMYGALRNICESALAFTTAFRNLLSEFDHGRLPEPRRQSQLAALFKPTLG